MMQLQMPDPVPPPLPPRLLLGSGVVRPGLGNEVENLWCASESERR